MRAKKTLLDTLLRQVAGQVLQRDVLRRFRKRIPIEAELAGGQAQQERQRQPSAAPPKEHPLVVVVVAAAGRLPRLLSAHKMYDDPIVALFASPYAREHVTSFRADDELARFAARFHVQSIKPTTAERLSPFRVPPSSGLSTSHKFRSLRDSPP